MQSIEAIEPNKEDLQEYVRCILGERCFKKAYTLFEDQVKVVFTSLEANKAEHIAELCKEVSPDGLLSFKAKSKLLTHTVSIGVKTIPDMSIEKLTVAAVNEQYAEVFGKYSQTMQSVFMKVLSTFLLLEQKLASKAFDSNFWKGAGVC